MANYGQESPLLTIWFEGDTCYFHNISKFTLWQGAMYFTYTEEVYAGTTKLVKTKHAYFTLAKINGYSLEEKPLVL